MSEDKIGAAVADFMQRRMDSMLAEAMTGSIYTANLPAAPAAPAEPLTEKRLVLDMARAVFDADVHITEFEPTPDKDGKVADAFVIDNTQLPGWEDAQRVKVMRGELPGYAKTIVFPSVEKAWAAVALATRHKPE